MVQVGGVGNTLGDTTKGLTDTVGNTAKGAGGAVTDTTKVRLLVPSMKPISEVDQVGMKGVSDTAKDTTGAGKEGASNPLGLS